MGRVNVSRSLDADSEAILYKGANLSQLAKLFKRDHRTIVEAVQNVVPCGQREGVAIYHPSELVPYLWKPTDEQIEEAVLRLNPMDLPKSLAKDAWTAMKARLSYQKDAGEVWETRQVVDFVGSLMKITKNQLQTSEDAVDRIAELSIRQRSVWKGLVRGTLEELHRAVKEKFAELPHSQPSEDEGQEDATL